MEETAAREREGGAPGGWSRWGLPLALALFFAGTLPGIGARQLWAPNEPNHAEAAREMVDDGHWVLPHINGEPYIDKPPLLHWMIAGLWEITGSRGEGWARIPSVFGGALGVLAVWGIALRLGRREDALWSALALSTMGYWLWQARWVEPDALLAGLVAASVCCFLWGWTARAPLLAPAGLLLGLALLTKGPVALVPFVAAAAPALLSRGAEVRGPRWIWLPGGALLVLAPPLVWACAARWAAGYDLLEVLQHHVLERGTGGLHHLRPWWYYLVETPFHAIPWFFLVPGAFLLELRRWRGGGRQSLGARVLLCWFAVPFLFFSLVPEKRMVYLLPLLPAIALLAGRAVVGVRSGELAPGWSRWALLVSAVLLGLVGVLVPVAGLRDLPEATGVLLVVTSFLIAGSLAGLIAFARSRHARGWAALGVATALVLGAAGWGAPVMDAEKGSRDFALRIYHEAGEETIHFYGRRRPALHFYAGRTAPVIPDADVLEERLRTDGPLLLLFESEDLEALTTVSSRQRILAEGNLGERKMVLARIQPLPDVTKRPEEGPEL